MQRTTAGKLRLFMRSRFKYEEVGVHPRVFLDGETGHLTKDIVDEALLKSNKASLEALFQDIKLPED